MYQGHDRLSEVIRFYEQVFRELKNLLSADPHPVFPRSEELENLLSVIKQDSWGREEFIEGLREVLKGSVRLYSPYYFGHMDSGVIQEIAIVDAVISFLNQNLLSWELSPAASLVERQVIDELGAEFGLPNSHGGTFVSGGTIANLTGLLLALREKFPESREEGIPPGVHEVFVSEQAHYSIKKAASIIGLGSNAIKSVQVTDSFQVDLDDLERQISDASDPLAVIGIAGTTSTGSFDDLIGLNRVAEKYKLWFHVDAAYGGALVFHPEKRSLLRGIERADSITFDPHKWLWQPKSTAVLLVRNARVLQEFDHFAPYIPIHGMSEEELVVNYGKQTMQGSRRFDALRYWVFSRYFGRGFMEKGLRLTFSLTEELVELIVRSSVFELVTVPEATITCFRLKEERVPNKRTREEILTTIHEVVEKSGVAWVSMTKLHGEKVLRFVILNLNSSRRVIQNVFQFIERLAFAEIEKRREGVGV